MARKALSYHQVIPLRIEKFPIEPILTLAQGLVLPFVNIPQTARFMRYLPSRMNSNEKKILIVEDKEDWRNRQACVVKRLGHVVIEAANGLAAIDQALATHPDLILMDLYMPKMGGDVATARLKAEPSTRDIPVIICTAFGPGSQVNRAIEAGATEIVHKPIKLSDLRNLLQRYFPSETQATSPVAEIVRSPIQAGVSVCGTTSLQ